MRNLPSLIAFILLVLGGGTLIGLSSVPDAWYAGLNKPSFTPPNVVFAPVWSALYIMIAAAGWRAWHAPPTARRGLMAVWIVQLALNFIWSPFFFSAHRIGLALADIVLLLAAIVTFITLAARCGETAAALLMLPYAAWVAFATALNVAFLRLNG
jgi:benzodiazapine receptor